MALPVKQAADLAKSMASKGLSGSIMMGEKKPLSDDEDMPEKDSDKSEMDACVEDLADAIMSNDKDDLVNALHALVDCIKQGDEMQDEDMLGSEEPS